MVRAGRVQGRRPAGRGPVRGGRGRAARPCARAALGGLRDADRPRRPPGPGRGARNAGGFPPAGGRAFLPSRYLSLPARAGVPGLLSTRVRRRFHPPDRATRAGRAAHRHRRRGCRRIRLQHGQYRQSRSSSTAPLPHSRSGSATPASPSRDAAGRVHEGRRRREMPRPPPDQPRPGQFHRLDQRPRGGDRARGAPAARGTAREGRGRGRRQRRGLPGPGVRSRQTPVQQVPGGNARDRPVGARGSTAS